MVNIFITIFLLYNFLVNMTEDSIGKNYSSRSFNCLRFERKLKQKTIAINGKNRK